jgi:hypothetical protein
MGKPNNTGTRILCVSGDVQKPGYYEVEVGSITMGELINDICGGMRPGRILKAVIPGGSSAKVLKAGETYKGEGPHANTRGYPDGLRYRSRPAAAWLVPAALS